LTVPAVPPTPASAPAGWAAWRHGGTELLLAPERAAWWPEQRMLLAADVHIGKAATFRALGVPVPAGTTAGTLGRLSALLEATAAARLVLLGDLLHAPQALEPAQQAQLSRWRARHASVEMTLVRGNHDARAGGLPPALGIDTVDGPLPVGPFALCHEPIEPPPGRYVLAGHLHPAVRLAGRADALRLPCYWFGSTRGVLPAFGDFTGALTVRPRPGDRVYAIAGDRVLALP
jgi:DNA ligase-associated metallophosphoesterase